jgi:hypothetical protein
MLHVDDIDDIDDFIDFSVMSHDLNTLDDETNPKDAANFDDTLIACISAHKGNNASVITFQVTFVTFILANIHPLKYKLGSN